ncbi:putative ABC transport system ATP-binding protein [Arcanobacterium pluranimalium]|uniref:ABC transporter ATP-binding protein n=1 Tax=Arcanobacterium pluranimalium TaxID=108028 RepID=UPI00195DF3EC|nr:ATP-binding cassette domain-containing protein [Arcanobacterium pluranimalium]MBM7825767.1 putative ABC transport system ATP-binding protein [Arcanobacterium pluranimalium]
MDRIPLSATIADVSKYILDAGRPLPVLDKVTFDIPAGQFTALLGPSGAGKSTLISLIAGIEKADSGLIELGDTNIVQLSDEEIVDLRKNKLGVIFESDNLLPSLTIEQNLRLPSSFSKRDIDENEFEQIVHDFGLHQYLHLSPHNTTLAVQQRTAIARALLSQAGMLICDDPVHGMARKAAREILSLLRVCVREYGVSVLITTEDPAAAAFADRVYLLSDGEVIGRIDSPSLQSILLAMNSFGYGEE